MGLLNDLASQRRQVVHAFIGTLSFSRHKFVEFVFSQDQQSFPKSHVAMFEFFSGSPKTLVIDNLKTGVLKPDIYDPTLNCAYAEFAEHYHTFIDPTCIAPAHLPIHRRANEAANTGDVDLSRTVVFCPAPAITSRSYSVCS